MNEDKKIKKTSKKKQGINKESKLIVYGSNAMIATARAILLQKMPEGTITIEEDK